MQSEMFFQIVQAGAIAAIVNGAVAVAAMLSVWTAMGILRQTWSELQN
jgi:hypothetical protein